MMNRYTTMLAVIASIALSSYAAVAQTAPAAPARPSAATIIPEQCQKLAKAGFTIKHETITRGGMAATTPRPGSYAAPRKYGEGGDNKWFIDSFPPHPKEGCRVCGVTVAVTAHVSTNSLNNDSITLLGSKTAAAQVSGSGINPVHTKLGGTTAALPNGAAYNHTFVIDGPTWMNWYMASPVPWFDVLVQDDTTVNSIVVTYYWY